MGRNWNIERLRGLAIRLKAASGKSGARSRDEEDKKAGAGIVGNSWRLRDGGPRAAVLRMRTVAPEAPRLREDLAQGTTEYAILVGVLVVIAIVAIIAFRDKVSELWEAISSGINSL